MITAFLSHVVKRVPNIIYYRTNKLTIKLKHRIDESWCLDGEEYATTERVFHFHVQKEIEMLVPKKNVQKLFKEESEI